MRESCGRKCIALAATAVPAGKVTSPPRMRATCKSVVAKIGDEVITPMGRSWTSLWGCPAYPTRMIAPRIGACNIHANSWTQAVRKSGFRWGGHYQACAKCRLPTVRGGGGDMAKKMHETPMLDQLESGPWPSFVTGLKRLANDKDYMVDLVGQ